MSGTRMRVRFYLFSLFLVLAMLTLSVVMVMSALNVGVTTNLTVNYEYTPVITLNFINNIDSSINESTTDVVFNEDTTQFRIEGIVPNKDTYTSGEILNNQNQEFYFFSTNQNWGSGSLSTQDCYYTSTENNPIWYNTPQTATTLYSIFLTPNCTDGTQDTIGTNTDIIISHNVTLIPNQAFLNNTTITNVLIPNSVTSIEPASFGGCSELKSIVVGESNCIIEKETNTLIQGCNNSIIPDGVASIGDAAFGLCSSLTNINIPDSVTSIGLEAFVLCTSLTTVTIGENSQLTTIRNSAFGLCTSLRNIRIPNSVTSIKPASFAGCSELKSIVVGENNPVCNCIIEKETNTLIQGCNNSIIPDGVASIGDAAFAYLSLTSITIPNSVTSIEQEAFENCISLTTVIIEENSQLTSIDTWAFDGCSSLTSIIIPEGVTSMGFDVFDACSNLTIYCEATSQPSGWDIRWNPDPCPVYWGGQWIYVDGKPVASNVSLNFVNNDGSEINSSTIQIVYNEDATQFRIEGIVSNNDTYTSGEILNNQDQEFYFFSTNQNWGSGSLSTQDCYYTSTENNPIWYNTPQTATTLYSIFLTLNCTDGTQDTIGTNTDIIISHNVTLIPDQAFVNNTTITSILIPNGVTSIGEYAFNGCSGLESIKIGANNSAYYSSGDCLIERETNVLIRGCNNSIIPNGVMSIGDSAFAGCSTLTSITIPEGVTSIGLGAFAGCTSLNNIKISDTITNIGVTAFGLCSSLTSIIIPDTVTIIGGFAFLNCSNLTIYCEATSQPSGWNSGWNTDNRPVYWGGEWEYVDGKPEIIE